MLNARINNSAIRSGIKSSFVNARASRIIANVEVGEMDPNVRVSSFQAGVLTAASSTPDVIIPIGTPIGLLLSLTYASVVTIPGAVTPAVFRGDYRPTVRIKSD